MSRTLYVTDLDGTLLQPDAHISPASLGMLNRAIEEGALFTIATARTPATVAPITEHLNLRLPAIVMTGTALWNKTTGRYSDVRYMEEGAVRQLVEIYRRMSYPTFLYTLCDDLIHIYHLGPLAGFEKEFIEERRHNYFKTIHIPESGDSVLPDYLGDTVLFYGIQPDVFSTEVYKEISEVPGVRAQKYYDFYGPETGILEAFSPLSTKALAIETLARRVGADRIVAFGDNLNDLPMLRMADCGVAVENAIAEVKAEADLVIGPNTADSVARFILEDMTLNL